MTTRQPFPSSAAGNMRAPLRREAEEARLVPKSGASKHQEIVCILENMPTSPC